ncbi:Sel1 domain protein repeat-containing protein [Hyphomicrobium sp. GJ21]|uniref:tetratricopeptide repeat protein n=1 Tax=Hyphomicrobium sp. GJ21 TaxID=113574 RepID=UPI000622BCAF|nr:tetratricopeptide repeat protein [Hyphomicrobium sp. GJ21]CEJ86915.1 Sel1 domain protein repeat-containing protein [Hyphomicrobium sp. GJ21]
MPSPEFNPSDTFSGARHESSEHEEEHSELKALVDAIAVQLSDATRRHSETLGEMQDRIAIMGREAEVLREHIPEQYAPTFEHIEQGVAELAKRLAKANDADAAEPDASAWDQRNAEALTHVYEAQAHKSAETAQAAYATPSSRPQTVVDQAWFEARFAEIARDIERSLEEIKPDRGFHQIGERLDQFEQRFGGMLEGVATRADLDSVRLIEEHVSEVVNHLVQTQDQLARLSAIEEQLAAITQTLSGGPDAPLSGAQAAMSLPGAGLDVEAIARAAAEQTALRLQGMTPASHEAAEELRPLIERMMEENRSGGENTSALLDTLQQAMIRLLDRVDEIELAQRNATPIPAASFEDFAASPPLPEGSFHSSESDQDPLDFSDDIEPAIPSEPAPSARARAADPFTHENAAEPGVRKNEKLRQDFIAEARRAKMRLSSAGDDDIVVTSAMHSDTFTMSSPDAVRGPQGSKPIRPTPARSKASGPSGPSPRLIVLAVAAVLALGGLWFTVGSENPAPVAETSSSVSPAAANDDGKSGSGAKATDQKGNDAQSPDGGAHKDQQGQLMPGGTGTANTDVSMLGVAVDLNSPATEASMQQAQRHQAMAALSGKLGDAASQNSSAAFVPASMVPTEAETEGAPAAAAAAPSRDGTGSTRFELPPAMVGPLSLRLAAANGDASAEFEVGARLAEGKGTPQDFKEAAKWYRRAADQDLAPAQYRLGTFYERGLGMKADRAQAQAWYKRAAAQGNVKAMHNLAVLSANQSDNAPDYTTAAQWFEQAAKRGLADSQFNLAILYENGLGVTKDLKQAYMWISLAAQDKDADAVRRQGILRSKLSASDLSEAERMISEWRAVPVDRKVNDARLAGEEWKKNPTKSIAG